MNDLRAAYERFLNRTKSDIWFELRIKKGRGSHSKRRRIREKVQRGRTKAVKADLNAAMDAWTDSMVYGMGAIRIEEDGTANHVPVNSEDWLRIHGSNET